MDDPKNNPYEQQLYAVFQSCLTKGETELRHENWLSLCQKLHLTEQSKELKSCIQQHKQGKQSISFQEFRAALLTLLGKTQVIADTDEDASTELQNVTANIIDNRCNLLASNNSTIDFLNSKIDVNVDENSLKGLWEKINIYLKENVDSATMFFISNCLGIPALPIQITKCIFEKLDQNCDGLINFDEFLVIFQNKAIGDPLDKTNEPTNEITTSDFRTCKTSFARNNSFLDTWKFSNITNRLIDGTLKTSEKISFTDLTTALCDELKNFNDSLDSSEIRSHLMLRDVLVLYQEELHSLTIVIENLKSEKEKLRCDVIEANERANALAQENDEQHTREEETIRNLRKQLEQRHSETVKDLSDQLSTERETNANVLKSKCDQIQVLQKENHEIRNKFVNTLQDYQVLETENESLRSQIEKLKQSNNELLTQIKVLAAEHDESQNMDMKHQEEVIFLVDRIKRLQSEAVLLRDQNDELVAELESFKDTSFSRQNDVLEPRATSYTIRSTQSNEAKNKDSFTIEEEEEESDLDLVFKHSTPVSNVSFLQLSYNSTEEDNTQSCKKSDSKQFKNIVIKQLQNILAYSNKCTLENCVCKNEISGLIVRLQSNSNSQTSKETDFVKSIASEMEAECEERTSESLRDIVSSKLKNSLSVKRASNSNINNIDVDNLNNQDLNKSFPQYKALTLRDYPPRKEENTNTDHSKLNKEKDTSIVHSAKVSSELYSKTNASSTQCESNESAVFLNSKLRELETAHTAEKKQLMEQCAELEKSLEMLKTEYEECEDYWAAKLEEERQLFEQEQKISDEKLSELIAKMAEYEELISPIDKMKNSGRLSPIEEKFNLEQQYLDLEEEFERWKIQMEEEISQRDKSIKNLQDKIKSLERPVMADMSVQVKDEPTCLPSVRRSHDVPNHSFNLRSMNDSICKLPEEYAFNKSIDSSTLPNNLIPKLSEDNTDSGNCDVYNQTYPQFSTKSVNNSKIRKGRSHWNTTDVEFTKEKNTCDAEYDFARNILKSQNLNASNYQCIGSGKQICCISVSVLQNLSMKLQAQENKKHALQEYLKQQQFHIEHVLRHITSQHQYEITELQYLLRNTQERLQLEFQTNAQQAEQMVRTDILVKDLYVENACLTANLKRLQHHYHLLGLNAESTSL